jgi:hypothetical protein
MKKKHKPYDRMLEVLNFINDVEDDVQLQRAALRKTRPFVSNLRWGYKHDLTKINYGDENQRAAYLLSYYPHYIEGVYHAICQLPEDLRNRLFESEKARACFLGCGPAAEVLGWLAAINEFSKQTTKALAFLLDEYHWYVGQTITTHLAQEYWSKGTFLPYPISIDLTKDSQGWNGIVQRAITNSDFIIMQNCINDAIGSCDNFLKNLHNIIYNANEHAILIIIDLSYPVVYERMVALEESVKKHGLGEIICSVTEGYNKYTSNIETPKIITDELLIGDAEQMLVKRNHTHYYLTMIHCKSQEF